ncbi:MAG: hypothetical protein JXI43_12995 [Tissierellales bacterium]|nr:hypothetical protein [Tissierellales bacterium]
MTEKDSGKSYETKKKYRVDISRFTKNLNERIYSKGLWENVIEKQRNIWEGSFALADHPENEGSFKDVMGVWTNLHINEDRQTVRADITFVGPYGQKAIEILEAGGKIGFSSSGFGDLKEDGQTVDESTYQIERVADCVLNPSQQVFGTLEDALIQEKTSNNEVNLTEKKELHTMPANTKLSKFEERRFRETVESYATRIKIGMHTLDEKAKQYKELLSYFDESSPTDLKESIEKEIKALEEAISEELRKTKELKEAFGTTDPEAFKEGFSKLATETTLYERQAEDWKKIVENLQKTIEEQKEKINSLPTVEAIESLVTEKNELKKEYKEKILSLHKRMEEQKKSLSLQESIYSQMLQELNSAVKMIKESESANVALLKENLSLKDENTKLTEKLVKTRKVFEKRMANLSALPEVKHTDSRTMFKGFSENKKVENYYNDLERQHGSQILPFKEKILGCKTVFEAMRIYNNALVEMSESIYSYQTGDPSENKKLVEDATGITIGKTKELRLPKGWD